MDPQRVAAFVAEKTRASSVRASGVCKLSGGAIQENWAVDLHISDGSGELLLAAVVRCDAATGVSDSHSRAEEFALLSAAFESGVSVPEPLWLGDASVFGRAFFVMRRLSGASSGHRLVRDAQLGGDRRRLTRRLGEEIAAIQRISPSPALAFLERVSEHPALHYVAKCRDSLDRRSSSYPALEWGLRWLENHLPDRHSFRSTQLVLAHRDFRTGNFMVDENGLVAVLDWEFAGWSHPLEDLGWLCAPSWRFGQRGDERAAGGLGSRADLLAGYNGATGRNVLPDELFYWEVFAEVRWAMIAMAQGERHMSGRDTSLELALTGHLVPQLELQILRLTGLDLAKKGVHA